MSGDTSAWFSEPDAEFDHPGVQYVTQSHDDMEKPNSSELGDSHSHVLSNLVDSDPDAASWSSDHASGQRFDMDFSVDNDDGFSADNETIKTDTDIKDEHTNKTAQHLLSSTVEHLDSPKEYVAIFPYQACVVFKIVRLIAYNKRRTSHHITSHHITSHHFNQPTISSNALCLLQAKAVDELDFSVGTKIIVTVQHDDGWWYGRTTDGQHGVFPSNYVQEEEEEEVQQPAIGNPNPTNPVGRRDVRQQAGRLEFQQDIKISNGISLLSLSMADQFGGGRAAF